MTSLKEELQEQTRWRERALVDMSIFDTLLANEFDKPEGQKERIAIPLRRLLRVSARYVPFYRARFSDLGIQPDRQDAFECLERLPVLQKEDVQHNFAALTAEVFPEAADRVTHEAFSSGTTGRQTRVLRSARATQIFGILKQREYRWFRFNPAHILASIRLSNQLPKRDDGSTLPDGEILQKNVWDYMEGRFKTAPHFSYNVTNPVEDQLAVLRRIKPRYLLTYSETLEHLAFASAPNWPEQAIESVLAISEQLTPDMRRHVERSFGAQVHQNYGLNEIGLVAVRCTAGRYHVHTECSHVEILDDEGKPTPIGQTGRLIVTSLLNTAMPLIRFDTGDLAVAVDGDCPCGRTMPAFGEIIGRYSRIAFLPEGTLGLVGTLRSAIEEMAAADMRGLQQFQIHQYRDNRFELRIVTAAPLPAAFEKNVRAVWATGVPLVIQAVAEIPRPRGGKFQVFTSDFMPALSVADPAAAG